MPTKQQVCYRVVKMETTIYSKVSDSSAYCYLKPKTCTIMDKSLGTNLHLWCFFTRTKQTVTCEFNYTCSALPPTPPTMLYTCARNFSSSNIVSGGGGGQQCILKRIAVPFQAPFLKQGILRNFVHHCRTQYMVSLLCSASLPQRSCGRNYHLCRFII